MEWAGEGVGGLTVKEQELLLGFLRSSAVMLLCCGSVFSHGCQVKGFLCLGVDAGQHPNFASLCQERQNVSKRLTSHLEASNRFAPVLNWP